MEADAESDAGAVACDGATEAADSEPAQDAEPQEPPVPYKDMYVGTRHAGETWRCVLGEVASCVIGEDGVGRFPAGYGQLVSVYLPEEAADRLDHIPIVMPRA